MNWNRALTPLPVQKSTNPMSTSVTLSNYLVLPLFNFLGEMNLVGKESRTRTRFIKMILDRAKEIEQERLDLLKKHAAKDADGKTIYFDKDKQETTDESIAQNIKIGNSEGFAKEYNELLGEKFIIDVMDSSKETLNGIKEILLNTDSSFKGNDAAIYDEICTAFETLSE